jgi:hypothetical protein
MRPALAAALAGATLITTTAATPLSGPVAAVQRASDPGPGVEVCVEVHVLIDLRAGLGLGKVPCVRPTPAPPAVAPSPDRPRPPVHRAKPAVPIRPVWHSVPLKPAATPSPSPSPRRSWTPAYHRPVMHAQKPVRRTNPIGTVAVIVVLSVAIALAGAAAFGAFR